MLNVNNFKKEIRAWVRSNEDGTLEDFVDFCEDLIPPHQYSSYSWLLEQSSQWFQHVIKHRELSNHADHELD